MYQIKKSLLIAEEANGLGDGWIPETLQAASIVVGSRKVSLIQLVDECWQRLCYLQLDQVFAASDGARQIYRRGLRNNDFIQHGVV